MGNLIKYDLVLSASKPNRNHEVSERFKNHAYNRQPSPVGRFLASGRVNKDYPSSGTSEEYGYSAKEKVRSSPPKSAVTHGSVAASRSDDMRRRMEEQSLELESRRMPTSSERVRPKTTEYRRNNDKPVLLESPSFENKVLLAVKDVLSRAVIEKGKIDVNNINTIIDDMKNRLRVNETVTNDSDDESITLDVNLKRSTTRLNIFPNPPPKNNTFLVSKAKPLPGIIRRNIVEPVKKTQKIYKTVNNRDDSPPVQQKDPSKKNTYEVVNNNYESTVYIDIPDSDYSNFNSLIRKEAEKSEQKKKTKEAKQLEDLALKKEQQTEALENSYTLGDAKNKTEVDSSFIEGRVGDCNLGACQPHNYWKTAEDVKLQNYIETLIRNMNDQLNGNISNRAFENQVETEQTVCKSFCVCKVCVSSKTSSSRKTLNEIPSSSKVKGKSHSELKLKNSALNNSIATANSSKLKQSKVFSKDNNKESHFRILQRNANFQPDSKLNLASRYAMGPDMKHGPSSSGSYMMVAPEEASEDLYLQRRVNNTAPVKRRMSTKI